MAPANALPILEITETSFKVNKENFISVLKKVGSLPFALFSINGATRTGKSYALNHFIRYLEWQKKKEAGHQVPTNWFEFDPENNFVWRSGKERETKGINLWSEPYYIPNPDYSTNSGSEKEIAILLMDCQGLFDDQTTSRQNAIIFSFSALCSSVSIFNLMKNIDEKVLQDIQFFSGYANLVSIDDNNSDDSQQQGQGQSSSKTNQSQAHQETFQNLVFLLRDFDFPDYSCGFHALNKADPPSELNYFHDVFILPESKNCPQENIFVREKILSTYRNVACFLLPHPGKKFVGDKSGKAATDADFQESLTRFIEMMMTLDSSHSADSVGSLITKKIGGLEVTGLEFQKYIEAWATLCEKADEHFPPVQTIMETTAVIQNNLAFSTANNFYERKMEELMDALPTGVEEAAFVMAQGDLEQKSIDIFDGIKKLGSPALISQYRDQLIESIKRLFNHNLKINTIKLEKEMYRQEQLRREEEIKSMRIDMEKISIENAEERRKLQDNIKERQAALESTLKDHEEARTKLNAQIEMAQEQMQTQFKNNEEEKQKLNMKIMSAQEKLERMSKQQAQDQEEYQRELEKAKLDAERMRKQQQETEREFQDKMRRHEDKLEDYNRAAREWEERH